MHTPFSSRPAQRRAATLADARAADSTAPGTQPFDALAADYDRTFSESLLGKLLREAVHEEIEGTFAEGDSVLDLGCGTGEDACLLARRGVRVHGVDQSPEMLKVAHAKTRGLDVSLTRGDLASLSLPFADGSFDGAIANFGALNTVGDCRGMAREVGRLVRPGGRVFLVVMGRWCPWEWLWYLTRGHAGTALRRTRGSAASTTGPVYYPSSTEITEDFSRDFEHVRTAGIGVILPPTYAGGVVERFASFFRRAARLERRIRHGRFAATFNDHYLVELRRKERPAPHLFACPSCGAALRSDEGSGILRCAGEGRSYERRNGILHLLADNRAGVFETFVAEYDEVRQAEGRGTDQPAYYRRLPFEDTTERFTRDWKIRAASYNSLVRKVVEPLERTGRVLRILDLGAGCGWFSYRMAQRGHEAFAVDLRTDDRDGLGAHVHYDGAFTPVRAEFDRLPFAPGTFDLVVFNASFHYAEEYERTLTEALRVLSDGGRIAVVDSPIYRRSFSGSWMVAARQRAFVERYGFASNSIKSEHFLTLARLQVLSAQTGVTWTIHKPMYGVRWALRPFVARLSRRCEPARFAVIEGTSRVGVENDLRSARPWMLVRSAARTYHRIRRLLTMRDTAPRMVHTAGLSLEIDPGVFDPLQYRSGTVLAEVVRRLNLEGRSVLDLGTGSGIGAIVAALRGAKVTAGDISPQALECTERNADAYQVDVNLRTSDLFDGLSGARFDVILFNPPYFRGEPAGDADYAWRSPDVIERFARELPEHLTESGYALVVLSTDGACPEYLRTFDRAGFRLARVARRRFSNETLTVYRLAR